MVKDTQTTDRHAPEKGIETTRSSKTERTRPSKRATAAMQEGTDWNTGRPAELATLDKIRTEQGSAIDLNSPQDGGHRKYPIYDVVGPQGVYSVKHFGQGDGDTLSDQTLGQYRSAIWEAMGAGTDPHKFDKAAEGLQTMAKEGRDVPAKLAADPQGYLREYSFVAVPSGHEKQIKDDLSLRLNPQGELTDLQRITRDVTAEQFGLGSPDAPDYQHKINHLFSRIVPLDKTSGELKAEFEARKL